MVKVPASISPMSPRRVQTTKVVDKSPWQIRLKKVQRFLSDCSMGQHYHVFFHKRRYSYGSPVCGLISVIVYLLLIYYMLLKFYLVFIRANYNNVETYKPIDFNSNNLTISNFLTSIDLEITIQRDQNQTTIYNCYYFIDNNFTILKTNIPDQ